ncbi:MAG: retention module-containing protein, partial [Rhodocyclaceae bacterium]|nr:retention module-containing protein [Rhodocyclaceae bacterium]
MTEIGNVVGKVVVLQGQAFARGKDGAQRALKLGEPVYEGETIVTGAGSHVELAFDEKQFYLLREKESVTLDKSVFGTDPLDARDAALLGRVGELADITRAIAEGSSLDQLLEETAEGFRGGGLIDSSHEFVRLLRIAEAVAPVEYEYGTADRGFVPELVGGVGEAAVIDIPLGVSTTAGTDDLPLAVANTATLAEDAVNVTGNVRTNDTLGDGTAAENLTTLNGAAVGSYGTISLGTDGSYTYTLNNANPLVQQLAPTDTLTE